MSFPPLEFRISDSLAFNYLLQWLLEDLQASLIFLLTHLNSNQQYMLPSLMRLIYKSSVSY